MGSRLQSRITSFRTSLRARVALGVALPILLVLISLSLVRYQRERRLWQEQTRMTVLQLGDVLMGGLRHAMLTNDRDLLAQTLSYIEEMDNVQQVQLIDLYGRVTVDGHGKDVGIVRQPEDWGCIECHRFPAGFRPNTIRFSSSAGVLRLSVPILNGSECAGCHARDGALLGVLLADVSVIDAEKRLSDNLRIDLTISVGSTLLVTFILYVLIHGLVVRRVEAFHHPLTEFASGDFTARLPKPSSPTDELGELADTFNRMADEIERHIQQQEERGRVRQRAIVEERERIARELHDGLAQLLGYVNTKAMAVRLMLQREQPEAADKNLLQLEEAARELFVDVREAILNLKATGENGSGLTDALQDFTAQFSRLSGLAVELALAPTVENVALESENALQLLRIVQESLTNVRKHASATQAWVSLQVSNGNLELVIRDDGKGFDPEHIRSSHHPRFGLSTMRERAETIGAKFVLDSRPGDGTRVRVHLPLGDTSGKTQSLMED